MGREIKFRAWDGERLRAVGGLGWVDGDLDSVLTSKYHGPVEEEVAVMQFTGLKDKNGVEIYEGDILTSELYPFQDEGRYNYHGVVEWIDYLASFYVTKRLVDKDKRGISDGISEQIENVAQLEVIGNIYENPELLSEK